MTQFTVVIPTRDRCDTLYYTIRACLEQDYDNYTVLVSDNVSTDATRDVVQSFSDSRLKYVRPPTRLGMASHFNFAIGLVSSGWITSVGDDDALMPGCLNYAASLAAEYGDLPIAARSVYYGWPQLPDAALSNRLIFRNFSDKVDVRDSRAAVREHIDFSRSYEGYIWGLAGIYRGFVPAALVKSAMRNGRYIGSVTPDAYSAFVTALLSEKYVHTERALFIEGVSARSNGAAQSLLADTGEEKRYLAENDLPLNPQTVYCPAPAFVMIEAFLQAKAAFPELAADLAPDFRRMCLHAALQTLPQKAAVVRRAIEAVQQMHKLRPSTPTEVFSASLWRRVQSVRRAWTGLSVDGSVYGLRTVHDASIAASAIWNYKCGRGKQERWALVIERLERVLDRRRAGVRP